MTLSPSAAPVRLSPRQEALAAGTRATTGRNLSTDHRRRPAGHYFGLMDQVRQAAPRIATAAVASVRRRVRQCLWRTLYAFAEPTVVNFPAPGPFHEASTVKLFERAARNSPQAFSAPSKQMHGFSPDSDRSLIASYQSVVESRCSPPQGRMAKPKNENNIPTPLTV
jgi:hypothetical protein